MCLMDRRCFSSQLECLCNSRKHVCNSLSFGLMSSSIVGIVVMISGSPDNAIYIGGKSPLSFSMPNDMCIIFGVVQFFLFL